MLDAIGVDRPVTLEIDQTTPLGHAEVRSIGDTIRLFVESGALEDPRRIRKLSVSGAATVLGRLLFRVRDRLDPAFGEPPADDDISLDVSAAWDVYCAGRLVRLGYTHFEDRQRRLYQFRTRHGFTDTPTPASTRSGTATASRGPTSSACLMRPGPLRRCEARRGRADCRGGSGDPGVGLACRGARPDHRRRVPDRRRCRHRRWPSSALLGLVLVLAGVALAVGLVRSLGLPHSDAGRRKGIRLEGPWVLLRAELEEAGSVPPRVLWSLQTVLLGRTEVPPEVGARIDPEGAERLAARLATGTWPGGARVPVTELSGDDAVIVVGRRSGALGSFELR